MFYIYVLLLQDNKYYIGKTNNPQIRIEDHFNSEGSVWTKKYRPVSILEIIETEDTFDEDKITLKYMDSKGINNVRGGTFSQIKLSREHMNTILHMIKGSNDQCFICGSNEHFANDCSPKVKETKEVVKFVDGPCKCATSYFSGHRKSKCLINNVLKVIVESFEDEDENIEELKTTLKCDRCGRTGHFTKKCYAKTTITGESLVIIPCSRCFRKSHSVKTCYAKTTLAGVPL